MTGDPMPRVTLHPADAAELTDMLSFISDWLARDPAHLQASLTSYTGHPAYTTQHLRDDLNRFAFLLGASDSGQPQEPQPGDH